MSRLLRTSDLGLRVWGFIRHSPFVIRRWALLALRAAVPLPLATLAADLPLVTWQGETMGSAYTVKIVGATFTPAETDRLRAEVEARLREVNRQMSHYQPDSELSRFNRSESTAPFKVSAEFARVTRFALELHRQSGGAFDPTLGPLINLWGFGQAGEVFQPPSDERVEQTRKLCGCQHLSLTPSGELKKAIPQLQLNLSAVAKGFGVDEAARVLRARGHTNVFVEIGGEVVGFGVNPAGLPWRVGVESPLEHVGFGEAIELVVPLSNAALATSGSYRKFITDAQGRRYSHVLLPKTGRPVQHDLVSVSVVAPDCLTADGLATTLFVLGPDEGPPWLERTYPRASALFMVRASDGPLRKFTTARFPNWSEALK